MNASLRVIKTGLRRMGRKIEDIRGGRRGRTRSLAHLSRPQSTVQDKSSDVMLLLTNGIARNSALSYEHVCNGRLSHRRRTLRDLSLYRSPRPVIASTSTLSVSLSLSIYLSRCRERRLHRSHDGVLR